MLVGAELLARRRRLPVVWNAASVVLVGVAVVAWVLGTSDSPLCDEDSWAQPHALWHLLSAIVVVVWVDRAAAAAMPDRPPRLCRRAADRTIGLLATEPGPDLILTARRASWIAQRLGAPAGASAPQTPRHGAWGPRVRPVADSTIVFLILAGVVVLFVSNRVPVEVVAIGTALSLWATDVLDLNQALAGFGDPTVLFIAALFVVSEALDATGVTAWAGQQLVARAGDSRRRLLVLMMLMCAALTAFISVNGAVAALVPVVVVTAVKLRTPSSQLMMPLAFAAHAGSMLTLTGSPVNVLVSEAADDAGADPFGYFEFTLVGIPLLVGTIVIVVLFGNRLLPHRNARYMPADFSEQARVLLENYELDHDAGGQLFTRKSGVAEVIVRPRSGLIGETAFPGMVTESGDLVVLAVHRKGEDLGPKEVTLAAGDVMLLKGTWDALAVNLEDPDVLVVDEPRVVRRQAVPLGPGAKRTLVIVARDGGAARHRGGSCGGRRAVGRRGADPDPGDEHGVMRTGGSTGRRSCSSPG